METWECIKPNTDKVNHCPDNPGQLLLSKAVKRLDKITAAAQANIGQAEKAYNQSWIGCNHAWAKYTQVVADAKSEADCQTAWIEYLQANAKCATTQAEYFAAQSEYPRVRARIFWKLFADPRNRLKIWRPDDNRTDSIPEGVDFQQN